MANTLQDFLVSATEKAASDLLAAVNRIPGDKLDWSAGGRARTVLDQLAECALLTGYTAELTETRVWSNSKFATFTQDKADVVALGVPKMTEMLQENTQRMQAAIRALSDDDLGVEIELPGSKRALANIISMPYWNMSYHLGQINFIASQID